MLTCTDAQSVKHMMQTSRNPKSLLPSINCLAVPTSERGPPLAVPKRPELLHKFPISDRNGRGGCNIAQEGAKNPPRGTDALF